MNNMKQTSQFFSVLHYKTRSLKLSMWAVMSNAKLTQIKLNLNPGVFKYCKVFFSFQM